MTELIMPWDEDLEPKLVVEFQCAQHQPALYVDNTALRFQSYGMPPLYNADPYAYATFAVSGYQFKQ